MYTNIKSVLILISLLKQHDIRHVVISPGTRNTAFVHSIETDDFFICYSVVDERSAGFMALGISEALDVPVCLTCTAATATCNYMPAVKEAYERELQLVALTADQDPYTMFHMEDQCINQVNMYDDYIKYAVDIPEVMNEKEYWYCNRCINEALLELNHNGKGPVQINYHMSYTLNELSMFPLVELPQTRKISRINGSIKWDEIKKILSEKKKILVSCGSDYEDTGELHSLLREFQEKYNVVVMYDYFGNQTDEEFINPVALGDVINIQEIDKLRPELIIMIGNVFYNTTKYFLSGGDETDCWSIAEDGMINDGYRHLTNVFEMSAIKFFKNVVENVDTKNDNQYKNLWKYRMEEFVFPNFSFTNFFAINQLAKEIPQNSVLHLSVLDSIRLMNYVKVDKSIKCFANIGADGIDGALSTFLGQASKSTELAILIIGDLSFMYDMNALMNNITDNVRIFVVNNYAGAEFHKNFGLDRIDTLNLHIAAGHKTKASQFSVMGGLKYLSATNQQELDKAVKQFVQKEGGPKVLEVFTDADIDAKTLKEYWKINRNKEIYTFKQKVVMSTKKIAKFFLRPILTTRK